VREIIERVRSEGDAALYALTRRFDAPGLRSLVADRSDFAEARRALSGEAIAALERSIRNVERFHAAQSRAAVALETEPGVRCEQLVRPLASVGLYVPGGTAPLPSTVIMLGTAARVADCPQRALCTPPRPDGNVHPAVLVAAQLCGIDTVFKVGGAQAIAALAYGTQTIPRVDKIFGPGNAWVTCAKVQVANDPAGAPCDLPAGPSEVLVVADGSARADFVAADLLAQAEHDELAHALLVTDSRKLAERTVAEIQAQRQGLSRQAVLVRSLAACRIIVVPDLETAFAVSNEYAPEHLILQVSEPRQWLNRVRHAGAIFLGPWSPEAAGDYCTGANHVLPTYGYARALSGLGIRDFMKVISVQELTRAGLARLGPTAVTLARLEGLDAHAGAVTRRLAALEDSRAGQSEAHVSAQVL